MGYLPSFSLFLFASLSSLFILLSLIPPEGVENLLFLQNYGWSSFLPQVPSWQSSKGRRGKRSSFWCRWRKLPGNQPPHPLFYLLLISQRTFSGTAFSLSVRERVHGHVPVHGAFYHAHPVQSLNPLKKDGGKRATLSHSSNAHLNIILQVKKRVSCILWITFRSKFQQSERETVLETTKQHTY